MSKWQRPHHLIQCQLDIREGLVHEIEPLWISLILFILGVYHSASDLFAGIQERQLGQSSETELLK